MRLQIRPPSLWLAYDLTRPDIVAKMLPEHLTLASVPLLRTDRCNGPKLLINAYDVSSLWMNGHRVEVQTIAKDTRRNTIHFVILQCLSNVNQWDPLDGVQTSNAVCRRRHTDTTFDLSVTSKDKLGSFNVTGTYARDDTAVSRRFVVDANLECYYRTHPDPFPLTFDEDEVLHPVRRLTSVAIQNTLWSRVRKLRPSHVFVHRRPMTYRVDVANLWYDLI